nr:immunoglobulin heavy chain junction region [Macaca mulatta]
CTRGDLEYLSDFDYW